MQREVTVDTYAYIYSGSHLILLTHVNIIASNDDSAGGLDPLITVNLTAGVQYYYVFTDFITPTGAYIVSITTTSGGQVLQLLTLLMHLSVNLSVMT